MSAGGGLVTFDVAGGLEAGQRFVEGLSLHSHVANIGDVRSLAIHPASTTHSQGGDEDRLAAGVTPGLIRHYFSSKDELIRAAYRRLMEWLTQDSSVALLQADKGPKAQLVAFVQASLRPPVVDPARLGLWAGFLNALRRDPEMRVIHDQGYRAYRDLLEALIAALPRDATAAQCRRDAIACNAVIDGLWLEGSALPEAFAVGELEDIGIASVSAILGIDLKDVP